MPNEEIISALRNAIEHGESLQSAVQIMINSGYNSEEVNEASRFVGGTFSLHETKPEEQLTMPEQRKSFSSKFKFWGKNQNQNQIILKPSESMKLASEPLNKQKIALTQTIQQSPQQPIQQQNFQQQRSIQQTPLQAQQLSQYPQQITQAQIKQSFQRPFQEYPQIPVQQQRQFQQNTIQPQQFQQQSSQQSILKQAPRPTPQLMQRQGDLSKEIQKIKPVEQGYLKEIVLLIILLILIGVLAATIFFKDKILAWFA